jgi:UDP-N-acetylglucosamine 1-carboxyvinyltransferase
MEKFLIHGGVPLTGSISISGSKNSALPALAASLLTDKPVILDRVPHVRDIRTMARLLADIGAEVDFRDGCYSIRASAISSPEAPYELVKTMRASSLVLGPLVARTGRARVSLPGGCAIGARPINLHIAGLEKLGAEIRQEHGYIEAVAPAGLRGAQVRFERTTVTGTEDLLMAAVLAEGDTVLDNAAREPEVIDLAELLTKMGAQIEGAGSSTISIRGVARLQGASHSIIPDRIEAGTFLVAGAITGGDMEVVGGCADHLTALTDKLQEAGAGIRITDDGRIRVKDASRLAAVDVATQEFPGFATDLQAQWMALSTQAHGASVITERIFENRFMHALEICRMGADITIQGSQAVVRGKTALSGAGVIASDLRASASLVLAGLVASGETVVDRVYHIDRGYEKIEEKLCGVGARIRRIEG